MKDDFVLPIKYVQNGEYGIIGVIETYGLIDFDYTNRYLDGLCGGWSDIKWHVEKGTSNVSRIRFSCPLDKHAGIKFSILTSDRIQFQFGYINEGTNYIGKEQVQTIDITLEDLSCLDNFTLLNFLRGVIKKKGI